VEAFSHAFQTAEKLGMTHSLLIYLLAWEKNGNDLDVMAEMGNESFILVAYQRFTALLYSICQYKRNVLMDGVFWLKIRYL
jgi:hypothetical protein